MWAAASLPTSLLLTACDGVQSAMGADGAHGRHFSSLFSLFLTVTGIAFLLVMAFLTAAIVRRRGERRDLPDADRTENGGVSHALIGWLGFILVGLTVLTTGSYLTDRAGARAGTAPEVLRIVITANQWWWDVQYLDPVASNIFRTANELHLPVGMPVQISLKSNDVIHSFWVPNLAGKQDMIPGRQVDIALKPLRTGIFRAQCAEFCGMQHAHMALDVTVESHANFDAWRQRQRASPPPPSTPLQLAGYNFVIGRQCSGCHAISGTPANAQVAPDLTHFASRRTIAAGTLPNTRGHLYGWIADPQGSKPGSRMPTIGMDATQLHAVVAYLETLK